MTLPIGYSPLPFSAARGVPQTVPFLNWRVTLLATSSDVPALLQTQQTEIIVNMRARCTDRVVAVPEDEQALFRSAAPSTLEVVTPMIIVRDNETIIGSLPAFVRQPLRFGMRGALAVEIYIDELSLAAASLSQPGDVGAQMLIGIRDLTKGVDRIERAAAPNPETEDLYDLA